MDDDEDDYHYGSRGTRAVVAGRYPFLWAAAPSHWPRLAAAVYHFVIMMGAKLELALRRRGAQEVPTCDKSVEPASFSNEGPCHAGAPEGFPRATFLVMDKGVERASPAHRATTREPHRVEAPSSFNMRVPLLESDVRTMFSVGELEPNWCWQCGGRWTMSQRTPRCLDQC